MNKKIWYLKQVDLFKGLPERRLKEIESQFAMKLYCKGHTVYQSGDSDKVYIVKTGKVELANITEDGQKFILDILGKGSIFGNLNVDMEESAFVETLDDSYICFLDKTMFFELMSEDPELSKKLMSNLYDRLLMAEQKAASFATDNVFKRFVKLVLSLGEPVRGNGKMMTDKFTHEQLSYMLGVSRQTVTTLINQMEREGKIARDKKRFVFEQEKLQDLVN